MTRSKQRKFELSIISLLKLVFPDTVRGNRYGCGTEGNIEGTPFRIESAHGIALPDAVELIEKSEDNYYDDERPRLAIIKEDRKEPIIVAKLTDFAAFLEKFLFDRGDPS